MNNNGIGLVLASVAMADHPLVMLSIVFDNMVKHVVAGGAYALLGRVEQASGCPRPPMADGTADASRETFSRHPTNAIAQRWRVWPLP